MQRRTSISGVLASTLLIVVLGSDARAQSGLALEVSGGVGLPGFSEWASSREIGPAASFGISGDFSQSWGWVVSLDYNRFSYKKELGETSNRFESVPPGDVTIVTTTDLEGGLWSSFLVVLGARARLSQGRRSRSYILLGLVVGQTNQNDATVDQTVTENDETTGPQRVTFISSSTDVAVGVTARLGVARRFGEKLDYFGEIGYEAAETPDDSFPDNPDFLVARLGIRVRL